MMKDNVIIKKNDSIIVLLLKFIPILIVIWDIFISIVIIMKIPYTEIDWKAYMEEVEGFLQGETNYMNLKGGTGPLVYPAGFVYIFAGFYHITTKGTNIFIGQIIFLFVYIINLIIVLLLYKNGQKVSWMSLTLLTLSKRIHSIYMLRLFNDCIAVLFGYLSILLFVKYQYRYACLFYSIGVSVKMNMLLYAPGILLVLLMGTGIKETIICLSICAITQLILGYPFLSTYPIEYLQKSFELGRVFMYKWTVNFKFLPEEIFLSKKLSILLLLMTLLMIVIFAFKWINENNKILTKYGKKSIIGIGNLAPNFIIVTIFTSNFIGVAFARTLHYQFYSWYFHTIPYLLWHINIPIIIKLFIFICIEIAFNMYPAIPLSSAILQICHVVILLGLFFTPAPLAIEKKTKEN